CTSSELENRCTLSKSFIRGENHMGRDQGNKLVMEVPECDVLTGNLIPRETCESRLYRDDSRLGFRRDEEF
ncbi:hypothetical protein AVEN_167189-1, partial [Araneus ventricosus]